MKKPASLVLGSLLGAVVIHFTLAACSGGSSSTSQTGAGTPTAMGGMMIDPTKDAAAQATPACTQWQIYTPHYDLDSNHAFVAAGTIDEGISLGVDQQTPFFTAPAGWEPFASTSGGQPIFRRCAM